MGRRSISTTKSGKFMNPTDQARKEARKRELKKNKRQRMLVRQAVLKNKDPSIIMTELKALDLMEFDPVNPPPYNIKVLQEKRRKLKETWDRVLRLYIREDPPKANEMKILEAEYEKTRLELSSYYESVVQAQKVRLDEIPLPEMPTSQAAGSFLIPSEIPLPSQFIQPPKGILKRRDARPAHRKVVTGKKPPGPPPGTPPELSDYLDSDSEYEPEDEIVPIRRRIRFFDEKNEKHSDREDDADEPYDPEKIDLNAFKATLDEEANNNTNYPSFNVISGDSINYRQNASVNLGGTRSHLNQFSRVTSSMPQNIRFPTRPLLSSGNMSNQLSAYDAHMISSQVGQNVFAASSIFSKPQHDEYHSATIEAKPQIRNKMAQIIRLVPTVLKIKRNDRRSAKRSDFDINGQVAGNAPQTKATDYAYDAFMKEMENLL